ncbi:MAG: T9SS type A sorting domain-containing protein, partial [Bacteroidota bacterium]
VYSGSSNGIYHSTDHGKSWSSFALQGMSAPVICISAMGTIFTSFPDSMLYRSTDSGKTWASTPMGAFNLNSLVADPDGDIFAVEWMVGAFRSTDDGETWQNIFSMLPSAVGPIVRSPLGIFYLSNWSTIYRSTDHGTTWQNVFEAPQAFPFNSAIGGDSKGNVYAAIENGGVYFSADTGSHWTIENSGLPRGTINGFAFNARGRVFAASDSGVFYHDGGSPLWYPVNDGLTMLQTACIAVDSAGYLYAGTTGDGVFQSIISTVLSVHENAGFIPLPNNLDQNYPNPFNPTTRIHYLVAGRGYVEIGVYDVLGQLVRDLAKGWKNPGEYFVDFNGAGLASGMYIYRLTFSGETGSFTKSKTMVLLK